MDCDKLCNPLCPKNASYQISSCDICTIIRKGYENLKCDHKGKLPSNNFAFFKLNLQNCTGFSKENLFVDCGTCTAKLHVSSGRKM